MTIYTRAQATALRLLTKYGQAVTVTKRTAGAYDIATGSAAVTETAQAGIGAIFDYGQGDIDGTLIQDGDKQVLLSPLLASGDDLVAPEVDDIVTIDGVVCTIKSVKTLAPGGTPVLYDLNVRV